MNCFCCNNKNNLLYTGIQFFTIISFGHHDINLCVIMFDFDNMYVSNHFIDLHVNFQVKAFASQRVVQVACGSRDAQTLVLTSEGRVYSWGDGDFGKLGRGGSEGCNVPHEIERLRDHGVCQIECGAQFSLALTKIGQVWTW